MRQAQSLMARRVSQENEPPKESRMPVESLPEFTKAARQRWESIPAEIRQRLLAIVWCGCCGHETMITNFGGSIKGSDLLLVGKCAECHGDVARVIEGA
jgi:hypothetical protein